MTDLLARSIPETRGAERAFAEEFDRLYALALRAARSRGLDREVADDVAQEAMTAAYANWGKIGHEPYLEAWVVRVANNQAANVYRRRERDAAAMRKAGTEKSSDHTSRIVLEHALQKLPRRQREVVVMRYLDDLDENAVAEALGCSVGTVRSSAASARRKLAEMLGDIDLSAFRAPAEAVSPDLRTRDEVVERGVMMRSARRTARVVGTGVVVVVLAAGAYLWSATRGTSTPPTANQTVTTPTQVPTTTPPIVTATPPSTAPTPAPTGPVPTTASPALTPAPTPAPAPAPTGPSGPTGGVAQNLTFLRNTSQYLSLAWRQQWQAGPVVAYEVVVTNTSGRTVDVGEFGAAYCTAVIGGPSGYVSIREGPCADLYGTMAPGESRTFQAATAFPDGSEARLQFYSEVPSAANDQGQRVVLSDVQVQ